MVLERKFGVVFGLFLELKVDGNTMFPLLVAQQSRHSFHCSVSHVELIQQNSPPFSI
jgi:hypothetical protein